MTQSLFTDAIAESYDDFRDLVRNVSATYYEVYSGSPSCEWENLFERTNPGEQFLRFNMQTHSEKGRSFFLQLHELERIAYGLPLGIIERPIPYFGSFVPPFGSICKAWTLDDLQKLIIKTKKEQQMGMQVTAEMPDEKRQEVSENRFASRQSGVEDYVAKTQVKIALAGVLGRMAV